MFVVAILLIVLSVPSVLLTVRASSKMLRRYCILRTVGEIDQASIPPVMLGEWTAVSSPLNYLTMLTEEMDRLGSLRAAILQAEIASALLIVLAFIPRYEWNVLICVIIILVLVVFSVLYYRRNINEYGQEYIGVMRELETTGDESADMIYG